MQNLFWYRLILALDVNGNVAVTDIWVFSLLYYSYAVCKVKCICPWSFVNHLLKSDFHALMISVFAQLAFFTEVIPHFMSSANENLL